MFVWRGCPCQRGLLHVGIDVLYVVELFEAFYHLLNDGTLLVVHLLEVVGDVGELSSDILEALLLKIFLYLSVGFRVTVDGDGCLVLVFVILFVKLVIDVVVDEFEDEFLHIDTVLFLEREDALVVEEEAE